MAWVLTISLFRSLVVLQFAFALFVGKHHLFVLLLLYSIHFNVAVRFLLLNAIYASVL